MVRIMKTRKISTLVLILGGMILFSILVLVGVFIYYKNNTTRRMIKTFEEWYPVNLPEKFDSLFYESITSIDSYSCYAVIKVIEEDYILDYDKQFYTEYAKYDTVNVFDKIELAEYYFENIIKEEDKKYFVSELENYDWFGYECKRYSGTANEVLRYVDVYIIHDINENLLYFFYDVHQYPYNEQWS